MRSSSQASAELGTTSTGRSSPQVNGTATPVDASNRGVRVKPSIADATSRASRQRRSSSGCACRVIQRTANRLATYRRIKPAAIAAQAMRAHGRPGVDASGAATAVGGVDAAPLPRPERCALRERRRRREQLTVEWSRHRGRCNLWRRQHGEMPRRQHTCGDRKRKSRDESGGPDGIARRGRTPEGEPGANPCERQYQRGSARQLGEHRNRNRAGCHHASSRARSSSVANLSSSSGASRGPSEPRSAATASPVEPSKNVCTRCFIADCRARSRSTRGK